MHDEAVGSVMQFFNGLTSVTAAAKTLGSVVEAL